MDPHERAAILLVVGLFYFAFLFYVFGPRNSTPSLVISEQANFEKTHFGTHVLAHFESKLAIILGKQHTNENNEKSGKTHETPFSLLNTLLFL